MNRLGAERSAYLTSAAHQPVHWHPWGEEAFATARAENKPVLLDIGAVWCHWCHVMDGESYEDADLARYLNEHFVCIKVDRDERPDVDARYQRAVQTLTGQGGWPLTVILTPDGEPFYGGTYFPPDERHGRPGFLSVLESVRRVFHEQRERVVSTARELRAHVRSSLIEGTSGTPSADMLREAAERMARLFDWRYGGFGTAPKFPHPSAVEFLLARWWDTGEPWLREISEKTLDGMARGGVYDHVGGGFHRYSVDERWCVPHFEKMSYDNAELLKVYARAHVALGKSLYREVAEGIIGWVMEVLADREKGGFGASQDADVDLTDDGDYFTWTPEEAAAVLDAEEWDAARRRWDIYPEGEMHHDPARNVLWAARSIEALAQELDLPVARVREQLEQARSKLKAARDQRRAPFVDRSIYTSWNAMMADAFFEAGAALDRPDCQSFALKTVQRLWDESFRPGKGMTHLAAGPDTQLLDDNVQAASAFLSAHEFTGDGRWLDRAWELMDIVEAYFGDAESGAYFDSVGGDIGFLAERGRPIQDAPTPSPNAVAALVLLRLHAITEDPKWRSLAARLLGAVAGSAAEQAIYAGTCLRAMDWLVNGECRIVVVDTTTTSVLRDAAARAYRPRKVIVPRLRSPVPGTAPPVALVCSGMACAAPVSSGAELVQVLETFARRR